MWLLPAGFTWSLKKTNQNAQIRKAKGKSTSTMEWMSRMLSSNCHRRPTAHRSRRKRRAKV